MMPIPYGRHCIDEDDIQAVTDVLRNGLLTQGPLVEKFEQAIADYVGAKYAVAVSNGTTALHLAYLALGVSEDDLLLTTPNTFVATANAARFIGADVDFVDISAQTLNLDPCALEAKCSEHQNIKVIAPVHFAGLPCDMPKIQAIANSVNAHIVEDASHALGAEYEDGQKVGCCAYSDITTFSFHPVKMIAAGEGGLLTTNDEAIYRKLLRLRSHGIIKGNDPFIYPENASENNQGSPWYYEMQELGFNYRITDIQCALVLSQLKKLDKFLDKRKELASVYDKAFDSNPYISLPQKEGRARSSHHLYVLNIDFDKLGVSRSEVMVKLAELGVGTQVHYIPVHMQPYYKERKDITLPVAETYYKKALSIPLFYQLSEEQQSFVINQIATIIA